jgi:hypothetical protein
MSRTLTTENATVKRELVSPTTVINWDPLSNSGTLMFQMQEMIYVNDQFIKSAPVNNISMTIQELVSRTYTVEVEPGVFVDVPGGLIMLAFKKAFEETVTLNNLGYPVA